PARRHLQRRHRHRARRRRRPGPPPPGPQGRLHPLDPRGPPDHAHRPPPPPPRVRKVAFPGSPPVGRRTMAAAAEHLKRVTLELGGSDPMIICDDAPPARAVSAPGVGPFFNCGQACVAPKRLFVFDTVADEVVERLVGKAAKLRVGPGTGERVLMGPMHSARQRALIEDQVADAVDRGATLLCGAARPQVEGHERGFFYSPTLLLEPPADARVAVEETFGPVLPIWRVGGLDEAIERANDSPYGLGSALPARAPAPGTT